jgi:hypothetical protein
MNERFQELRRQATLVETYTSHDGSVHQGKSVDLEKFAQLIVQECAVYCEGHILPKGMAEENGLNYNDGVMDCAIGLKQDFGVE